MLAETGSIIINLLLDLSAYNIFNIYGTCVLHILVCGED